jgi:hypothetical protein
MQKFKIEITQSDKYIIDVLAETESDAHALALKYFGQIIANGTAHYYADDETETAITNTFDVTNTDDPFSSVNEE